MHKPNLEEGFEYAAVQYFEPDIVVVKATAEYIPINEFQAVFDQAGKLVEEYKVKRLVFDKRALRVFDQPSMEWYFTEWKAQMADRGLTVHRKILPNDFAFRESVKVGHKNITQKHPQGKFRDLDIQYADSLEEAFSK